MAAAKGVKRATGLLLILRPLSTKYATTMPAQTETATIAIARRVVFMQLF